MVKPTLGNLDHADLKHYSNKRIALFYNYSFPGTTGLYVKRGLEPLCRVEVFLPSEVASVENDFDLFLAIDDGSHYVFPSRLKPSALWLIDTHLTFSYDFVMAMGFDFIFTAQRLGADLFIQKGFRNVHWLPLACDPQLHYDTSMAGALKKYDIGFVGNIGSGTGRGVRRDILLAIKEQYPNSYIGNADYTAMAGIYGRSRVVINASISNDLNMRVFEGMCSGSSVLTDKVDSIDEIFKDKEHLFLYSAQKETLEKIDFLLKNSDSAEKVATAGREEVIRHHTYQHRAAAILETVFKGMPQPHLFKKPIIELIRRHVPLQKMMLTKFFNMWIMLPLIDPRLLLDKLRSKKKRAITSAKKRLHKLTGALEMGRDK